MGPEVGAGSGVIAAGAWRPHGATSSSSPTACRPVIGSPPNVFSQCHPNARQIVTEAARIKKPPPTLSGSCGTAEKHCQAGIGQQGGQCFGTKISDTWFDRRPGRSTRHSGARHEDLSAAKTAKPAAQRPVWHVFSTFATCFRALAPADAGLGLPLRKPRLERRHAPHVHNTPRH